MLSLALRAVLREIATHRGARVTGVGALSGWEYRLTLDDGHELVVLLHPDRNALFLAPAVPGGERVENVLTRSLARALSGSRLEDAAQAGLDRVAAITFAGRDRLGDPRRHQIVGEFTGKAANLVLLEGGEPFAGRILDRLRADRSQSHPRSLTGGAPYVLPVSGRADLVRGDRAALVEALRRGLAAGRPGPEAMADAWEGMSPWIAEALWSEASAATPAPEPEALVDLWAEWVGDLVPPPAGESSRRFAPCVIQPRRGVAEALPFRPAAIAPAAAPATVEPFATMSEALAAVVRGFRRGERRTEGSALARALKRTVQRTEKARDAVRREATGEREAAEFRRAAEAVLAAASTLTRGATEAALADPKSGEPMTVKLNPTLTPAENAELLFKKARKAARSGSRVDERLEELERQLGQLSDLGARLAKFADGEPDAAWLEEAKTLGVSLPAEHAEKVASNDPEEALAGPLRPRRYPLGNGWEVLVGKSDRGNHILTFELSRPDDLWMHADNCPGSHVVLRHHEKGKEPPHAVLLTAAGIAAFFSKARNSTKVPVIVAEKRHVRRPRKAPLGQALVGEHRTLMVTPINPEGRQGS